MPTMKINSAFKSFEQDDTPIQILFGGASSGKSFYILGQRTVRRFLQGGRNFLILRNVGATNRVSTWNQVIEGLSNVGALRRVSINKSEQIISLKATGEQIIFRGLDNVEKLKSIKPANGVITDIIYEEATETGRDKRKLVSKRLRGLTEDNIKKTETLIFNPVTRQHDIFKDYFDGVFSDTDVEINTGSVHIRRFTYKDNLPFLTGEDVDRLESETDRYYYDVYTLGKWGVHGHVIFTNWEVCDLSDNRFDRMVHGLDFGYSPDKNAYICAEQRGGSVYIPTAFTFGEKTNQEIADIIRPYVGSEIVYCDNAEPKSIRELKLLGITAIGVNKGRDSVMYGVKWLQGRRLYVHHECQDLINELSIAKFEEDRSGQVIIPPVMNQRGIHCIAALRYAFERQILGADDAGAVSIAI